MKTVIDNTPLKQVDKCMYLVGTISSMGTNEQDVAKRIGLAAGASRSLTRIWTNESIKMKSASMRFSPHLFCSITQRHGLSRQIETEVKSVRDGGTQENCPGDKE